MHIVYISRITAHNIWYEYSVSLILAFVSNYANNLRAISPHTSGFQKYSLKFSA